MEEAIKLLGIPRSIKIKRGTESKLDSISIEYANHGIVLHFLNGKNKIKVLDFSGKKISTGSALEFTLKVEI